jgi:hypothetical protein
MNKEKYKTIKERLAKRFTNWVEKYMSMGAKEVLIKSVARPYLHILWGYSSCQ